MERIELMELHRRAVEEWRRTVEAVRDGQWHHPTPCADWDVRTLVNHLVYEDRWTRPIVEGRTIEEVGDRFEGDLLGEDPVSAVRDAAADALAAASERLPGGGTVHLSFGDVPMEEYVWQVTSDHVVHGWDLAAATGQDRTVDPDVVEVVAGWAAQREEMFSSSGVFAPPVGVAEGASAQDRLIARYGRDPGWSPQGG